MKTIKVILFCSLLATSLNQAWAQQKVSGIIMELVSGERVSTAFIHNLRTEQEVETNKDGSFTIDAAINDHLLIKASGYDQDTVFIYDNSVRRIYLNRADNTIELSEVLVERMTDSRLAVEIQREKQAGKFSDVSQYRGGIRISPSRLFSKEGKQARSDYKLLLAEQEKRSIDRRFTDALIQQYTPLEGAQLALFKEQYRPKYKFIQNAGPDDLKIYIIDSYKKFNTKK